MKHPNWHLVSFDFSGLPKSSSMPQITTVVPSQDEELAKVYLQEKYFEIIGDREIINLTFKN